MRVERLKLQWKMEIKFVFSKKATKNDEIFTYYLHIVKSMVNILSIFVAFLENMNFTSTMYLKKFVDSENSIFGIDI